MHKNTVQSTLTRRFYHAVTPFIVCFTATYYVAGAVAQPVTFAFVGQLTRPSGPTLPLPHGQRITGSYTFELSTPANEFPNSSIYDNALTDFRIALEGFGTGSCSSGSIRISNPGQNIGSVNFLADQYQVYGNVTGVTIPTTSGERPLISASMLLQDLDQVGLDSVGLSATPPSLAFFLDNSGPNVDSDKAEIFLTFDSQFGSVYSVPFQLTSLVAVPEPGTILLAIVGLAAACAHRRRSSSDNRV